MKNLSPKEKRTVNEIEEIRHIIYGYKNEDKQWIKEFRLHKLAIERDEIIRNFIIAHHLLTEEFINTRLLNYFIHRRVGKKQYKLFNEFILSELSCRVKITLAYHARIISKIQFKFLEKLNTLRNKCAHNWFLRERKIKLLYEGKNLLVIKHFREFAEEVFSIHDALWSI